MKSTTLIKEGKTNNSNDTNSEGLVQRKFKENMLLRFLASYLFVLGVCMGLPVRRKNMAFDRDDDDASTTSIIRTGMFSQIHKLPMSESDPDIYRNPRSMIGKEKINAEANHKREKMKTLDPLEKQHLQEHTDLHRSLRSDVIVSRAPPRESQQKLRRQVTTQSLRRRTAQKCEGLKKIVQCKNDVPEEVCKKDLLDAGVELVSDMKNTSFFAICVDSEEEALLVTQLTDVEAIEDDPPRTLSYIPESERIRHLQSNEQVIPYGVELVKAPEFWDRYGKRGSGVKVCVIDTGLRSTHEDLRDGDISGSNENNLVTPWDQDGNSHGTHVSGTVAATDNGVGVIGVAPDASIHVVRVFDNNGEFSASNIVDGMNACASAGSNIISMSLGGPIQTVAERTAIENLKNSGILLVAASGNDANGLNLVEYPAGYETVLSVGAVNENFEIASFSTHNTEVDIAGPGVNVLSTASFSDQSYSEFSGTSMATPHVAGVAALLWSQFPQSSADDIQNALEQSSRDFGACGKDRLFGHGVVDAVAAAVYMENGGGAATELSGCIDVSITLTTDDWGQETTYVITVDDNINNIVYRGGPYPNDSRSTYTDNIQLQEACYKLTLLDSYNDGNSNPEHGVGEIGLTYNGNKEVEFNAFTGSQEVFQFGSCGGDIPSPTMPPVAIPTSGPVLNPTPAPTAFPAVPSPTEAPVTPPATDEGCSSGESRLEMNLETDQWSPSENHLYLFDDAAPDDEWVWLVNISELQGNAGYEGSACLLPTSCYKFYFFDEWGDGLATGGLTLTLDGTVVFQISPDDYGLVFEQGSATTYWYKEFGMCTSTSTSNNDSI